MIEKGLNVSRNREERIGRTVARICRGQTQDILHRFAPHKEAERLARHRHAHARAGTQVPPSLEVLEEGSWGTLNGR